MYMEGHKVDFSKEGVTEFKCDICGATDTVLNAVFPETYIPKCKDCNYKPMKKINVEG